MTIEYWPPFVAAILLFIAFGFILGYLAGKYNKKK